MVLNLERKLVDHRFVISEQAHPLFHVARTCLSEIIAQDPEIKGMAFYGSRTKGYDLPSSDFDMIVFIDETYRPTLRGRFETLDAMNEMVRFDNIRHRAKNMLTASLGETAPIIGQHRSIGILDISKQWLDANINYFFKIDARPDDEIDMYLNSRVFELISLFFLAIGKPVYTARAYVVNQFAKRRNGNRSFSLLMHLLHDVERNRVKTDVPHVAYTGPLPTTIKEAKKYFLMSK